MKQKHRIDDPITFMQTMMDEVAKERELLARKWDSFNEAKHRFEQHLAQDYEFDTKKEMKEAMMRDFNPYSTFSVRKKKRKHV